jgi:nucleosome binding factor SPN SPT16 subunit
MSILFGWILKFLFINFIAAHGIREILIDHDHEVPKSIADIIQQGNNLQTGTQTVHVLNYVKHRENIEEVDEMANNIIMEIPKDNSVVRLSENWLSQKKFMGNKASFLIFVFDSFNNVSLLYGLSVILE